MEGLGQRGTTKASFKHSSQLVCKAAWVVPRIPAMPLEGISGTPVASPPSTAWLLPEQPTSSTCCHDKLDTSIVGCGAASVISQVRIAPAAAENLCK